MKKRGLAPGFPYSATSISIKSGVSLYYLPYSGETYLGVFMEFFSKIKKEEGSTKIQKENEIRRHGMLLLTLAVSFSVQVGRKLHCL